MTPSRNEENGTPSLSKHGRDEDVSIEILGLICTSAADLRGTISRGSITVRLTSCLFCLDSTALIMLKRNGLTCIVKSDPVKQGVSLTSPCKSYPLSALVLPTYLWPTL